MGNYLFLLLILACPLIMVWMMRGMHGSHGGDANGGRHSNTDPAPSLDELHRRRDELDHLIEEREAEEQTPVVGGWR